MTQFKGIKNFLTNYFRSGPSIESYWPKWVIAGLIGSALIGFAITWTYLHPAPTPPFTAKTSTQPRTYSGKLTTEARKTRDTAEEITNILSSQPPPTDKVAKIKANSAHTESGTGWSADSFLDVIKEPPEDSDTAGVIEMAIKQSTVEKKDPYVVSLVDEAVDIVLQPSVNRRNVENSSDQAAFYTIDSMDKTAPLPLHFNPDGSITVQSGDSLSTIALRLFHDESKYPRIYEANKDVLKNPDKLQIGTRLRIPKTRN